jgi:DNA-directed RNA polymerase subunit RPC12/RpoP
MKKVCFNCGHEFDYTPEDIQDNYWGRYLICPKCGHHNHSFKEKEDE